MKAVTYTRVSTGKQQINGVSLEAQAEAILDYCLQQGIEIVGEFSDTLSASTAQRPEFLNAVSMAKSQKAMLIVYSTSRFARDTMDQLGIERELRDAGSRLVSLTDPVETDTPQGEAMFTMMAAFNQMERRLIGERTKAAMQHMKAQGKRVGSVPHGYKAIGDKLVKDETEQAIIAEVKRLRAEGLSLAAISKQLAGKGVFNRHNRPYAPKSINAMAAA